MLRSSQKLHLFRKDALHFLRQDVEDVYRSISSLQDKKTLKSMREVLAVG